MPQIGQRQTPPSALIEKRPCTVQLAVASTGTVVPIAPLRFPAYPLPRLVAMGGINHR